MMIPFYSLLFLWSILIGGYWLLRFAERPVRSKYMEDLWRPWKYKEKERG